MFAGILRSYRNAGKRNVSIALRLPDPLGVRQSKQVIKYAGTGLDVHNLAGKGHRDLLRMAMQSSMPRRPGSKFEESAWFVAASILMQNAPRLLASTPAEWGILLPYTAFLGEYASKDYEPEERREVIINDDHMVSVRRDGATSSTIELGRYKPVAAST